ncbi:MAG: hypothetical protein D6731_15350 [Planctomycetota bacterium]|nr:MAG: hypothetical protein D6731_15350 [Planctomycetota bacterium]
MLASAHLAPELVAVCLASFVLLVAGVLALAPLERLRLPFTVALMLAGLGLGAGLDLLPKDPEQGGAIAEWAAVLDAGSHLSPQLILFVFLPPLVFESAFGLDARAVVKNLAPIAVLAVPVLCLSTVITGAAVMACGGASFGMTWPAALLFGALISATDPVAVVALFKALGAPKRLGVLVEGESLCNDGTAIVLFDLLLASVVAAASNGGGSAAEASFLAGALAGLGDFAAVTAGGLATGAIMAYAFFTLIGRAISRRSVEVTLSVVLAYSTFVVAEHFLHTSGVMACVAAGLVASSYGRTKVSPGVEHFLHAFWETMAFAMNALVFFLVGLVIARQVPLDSVLPLLPLLGATIVVVLFARAVGVFGSAPFLARLAEVISLPYQWVMWWGGLRGAVSLALALTVFTYVDVEQPSGSVVSLPRELRVTVLVLTAGVVLFTLAVNAVSMPWVLRACGLDRPSLLDRFAAAYGARERIRAIEETIASMEREDAAMPEVLDDLRAEAAERREAVSRRLGEVGAALLADPESGRRVAGQLAASIERREVLARFARGELTEGAARKLLASVDALEDAGKQGQPLPAERRRNLAPAWESRLLARLEPLPLLGSLARRLRARRLAEEVEAAWGQTLVHSRVAETLAALLAEEALPADLLEPIRARYLDWARSAREHLEALRKHFPNAVRSAQTLRAGLHAVRREAAIVEHMAESGLHTPKALADALEEIRRREAALCFRHAERLDLGTRALLESRVGAGGVSEDALSLVERWLISRSYMEGETVHEGALDDAAFVVVRGELRVYRKDEDGREVLVGSLGPGDRSSALGLGETPREVCVRAATPVNLLEVRAAG